MACLTTVCLETIGLNLRGNVSVRLNDKVSNLFSPTFHAGSLATFSNGKLYSLQLLTSRCGFNQTPGRPFNGCGTFTWTAQKQAIFGGSYTKNITLGGTWRQKGFSQGLHIVWATWSPNTCAKNVKVNWLGRTFTGVDATKSHPVNLWIY